MKDKRKIKADMDVADTELESEKNIFCSKRTVQEEGDKDMGTEEKKYTPYDGKENDWLAFARQQAEFYRNAGQYIVNLQILQRGR